MSTEFHKLSAERHRIIRGLLAADGRVLASDIAMRFEVSDDTARRDLRELAKMGECIRVYGGAIAPAPYQGALVERRQVAVEAKASLAAATVRLLVAGQTVFLDAGTTNIAIAEAIPRNLRLTVATNAIAVASALADHPALSLIVLGGVFDRDRGACLGAETLRSIERIQADLFVVGTCGVDARAGVTASDDREADVKAAMAARSQGLIIAATTDKLGTAAPFRVTDAASITHLVVQPDAPVTILDGFIRQGSEVHVA